MTQIEIEEANSCEALPLLSLNHVSLLCRSVWDSMRFYEEVLGFLLIKRPSSFNFKGAWLYNYGIGIHLIENPDLDDYEIQPINPKENHISFQCTDVGLVKRKLQEMGMRYVTAVVEDDGIKVDQVFFHDPDGYMIELCNCQNIPIIPVSSCSFKPRGGSFESAPTACRFMETDDGELEPRHDELLILSFRKSEKCTFCQLQESCCKCKIARSYILWYCVLV